MRATSFLIAAIAAGALTSAAQAADYDQASPVEVNPFYLEIRLGGPLPRDYDVTGTVVGQYDPDPGFMLAGTLGKYLTSNIRADIDISHAWAGDGVFNLTAGPPAVPHTGDVSATTILGNIFYEFSEMDYGITPWVGVGAGATIFDYDRLGGAGFQYSDSDTALTIVGHLGADYAISENLDLTGRYTLSWTDDHSIAATNVGPNPINIADQINHTFTVGLRFKFGG